jgi:hypothetical protein
MEEMQYLNKLEAILGQHRAFGDTDYLNAQLHACYERRLAKISARLPAAGVLLDTLRRTDSYIRCRVIGDTVVRYAINDAFTQLETETEPCLTLEECDEIFLAMTLYLKDNKGEETPMSRSPQIDCGGFGVPVWAGQHASGPLFTRAFLSAVQVRCRSLCESNAELYIPNDHDVAMLSKGAQLLSCLLPRLARSTLHHTHSIALFQSAAWKSAASLSQIWLSGTVFLGKEFLQNPWWVAEHLLHESLHQKLYDFQQGHSFLRPDFPSQDAVSICALWNTPGKNKANCWDTHRAVAAFHVYVHLALLAAVAERRAPELEEVYGSPHADPAIIKSRKAFERAHYLGEKIRELCWPELGIAGQRLVEWLISVLDALDPSPPPKGCYTHLLLDRYHGEGLTVQQKMDGFTQELSRIAKIEIEDVQNLLVEIGATDDAIAFNHAMAEYSYEELGNKFGQVRRYIEKAVLNLYDKDYRLKMSNASANRVQEIVSHMVETSSMDLEGF